MRAFAALSLAELRLICPLLRPTGQAGGPRLPAWSGASAGVGVDPYKSSEHAPKRITSLPTEHGLQESHRSSRTCRYLDPQIRILVRWLCQILRQGVRGASVLPAQLEWVTWSVVLYPNIVRAVSIRAARAERTGYACSPWGDFVNPCVAWHFDSDALSLERPATVRLWLVAYSE